MMKRKCLLIVTFFLTQATSVWAMEHERFDDQPQPSPVAQTGNILRASRSSLSLSTQEEKLPFHTFLAKSPEDIWILAVDGGGIRGIIPAQVLYHLEQILRFLIEKRIRQKITKRLGRALELPIPDRTRIANAFDLKAGTSTGGIIILGLSVPDPNDVDLPLYATTTLVDLYKDGEKVFPSQTRKSFFGALFSQKFDANGLESLFQEYFGKTTLNNTLRNVLITAYEMRQEKLCLFDSVKARTSSTENFLVGDVARATSAAPTYFSAAKIKNMVGEEHLFVDGGIIANNPAMPAFIRAKSLFPQARKITLLSLGTGHAHQDNLSEKQEGGLLSWGPAIASVMMDGVSDLNHHLLQELSESSPLEHKFTYLRLQPTLTKKRSEMDNVSKDNIDYLLAIAKILIRENGPALLSFAEGLAEAYEKRGYSLFPKAMNSLKTQLNQNKINLESLDINEIGAWEIADYIDHCPSLSWVELNISNNPLKNEGIEFLSPFLGNLRTLQVNKNALNTKGMEILIQSCPYLTSLNISENSIGEKIAILSGLKNLIHLNISATSTSDQGIFDLTQGLSHLQSFYADSNPINPKGGQLILENLLNLEDLSLKYTKAASGIIQALPRHVKLRNLDLSHNEINDAQTEDLCQVLKKNTSVHSLKLYYNLISAKGAQSLADLLTKNSSLRVLHLGNNNIGDDGVYYLSVSLHHNSTLETLDIFRNNITKEGMGGLCLALRKNTGLTFLGLKRSSPDIKAVFEQLMKDKSSLSIEF